jgi:2-polyprenyl-3-methyl-5-hydroxy-6-metoxy-1,4-benzoquinol methylase
MPSEHVAVPMPYTGERMVPEAADEGTFWEHVHRYKFATRFVANKDVLDIACGEGYGTRALLDAGARSVVGVDISDEVCRHATAKYGVRTVMSSAAHTPFADASFDVIVSFETIEHLDEPASFVDECARLLRTGGTLIISTPNAAVYSEEVKNSFHHREMTEREFVSLLSRRFQSVRIYSQANRAAVWYSPRNLSAKQSKAKLLPGYWRLFAALCPHLATESIGRYREGVVRCILKPDRWPSTLLNPYLVRPRSRWSREEPYYLLGVAQRQ